MRDQLSLSRPEPTRPGSWSPGAAWRTGPLPGYRGGDSPSRTYKRADAAVQRGAAARRSNPPRTYRRA
eukprot:8538602-Alexandrium_andersonii.AAC.1